MNVDKFDMDKEPFEQTLSLRLPSTAMIDDHTAGILKEWNSPLLYAEFNKNHFFYDVTGRVSLRSLLHQPLTKTQALDLFANVADAMLYCEENGINPKFMILDSDLVFVSEENGSMRFLCVPAANHGLAVKPLRAYIKELIVNMQYADSENLDYVGKLINYLNGNKRLDAGEFLDYLDVLADTDGDGEQLSPIEASTDKPMEAPVEMPVEASTEAPTEMPVETPTEAPVETPMETPTEAPVETPTEIPVEAPEFMPFEESEVTPAKAPEMPELSFVLPPAETERPEDRPVSLADLLADDDDEDDENETILHMNVSSIPFLVRKRNGDKVMIDKDEFKIGKIPGMADYLLSDNPAVSRMHAIIHKIDGDYYVCDNYSTNSTFLNGEHLEPGKNYILLNGARINFANEEFTYYIN